MNEKISVCVPVYNGAKTIKETIDSILNQSFSDFELIIVDNLSTDETPNIIREIKDDRIKLYINEENLGCGGNLEECKRKACGDIIFYICADDVADKDALKNIKEAFDISRDIGLVVRPYYWFNEKVDKPVRVTKQFEKLEVVSIDSSYEKIKDVISLADQISGIAFRKKYINVPFKNGSFIEMASVVAPMIKETKAVIIKKNVVAVRISDNGAMSPVAYIKSPMLSWYGLITDVFSGEKYFGLKRYLVRNFIANNFIGLVQIKNFGGFKALFREIYYLVKLKWSNIFNLFFWFFSLGTIILPRAILKRAVLFYKNNVNSKFLKRVAINSGG